MEIMIETECMVGKEGVLNYVCFLVEWVLDVSVVGFFVCDVLDFLGLVGRGGSGLLFWVGGQVGGVFWAKREG